MPSKSETFDNLVESYSKHPDQGLKLCKKKLQKDPNNSIYLLAQASFLLNLGRPQDAIASCDSIKGNPKDPLEPTLIVPLQNVVRDCQDELGTFTGTAGTKLSSLWKDALDQCPKQWLKETRSEMLSSALRAGFWDIAQQLFARLQREYPQNAKFHFAWIALCQIQADKLPADDKMKPSLKMLAHRSLKAIVENTTSKKDTTRKLVASADLRLLYQVYRKQGLLQDLLEILDSADVGITSDVGKNDIEFILVKMGAIEDLHKSDELRRFCLNGLDGLYQHYKTAGKITVDTPKNLSWAVAWQPWQTALKMSNNDGGAGSPEDVLKLAESYLVLDPQHRNAGNATLLYRSLFDKHQLLDTCKTFFEAQSSRVSCFDDLRCVIEGLNDEQKVHFCEYLSKIGPSQLEGNENDSVLLKKLVSMINALKLRYLLHYSGIEEGGDATILGFVAECLNVYQLMAGREDGPSDDACILAIAALMKLGSSTSNIYNLQAGCLAQFLRDNSQHNFNATLLQLLNARTLGLGSVAIAAFRDLSLREVQFDTLGHLLYTRIATLHPFAVSLKIVKSTEDRYKDPKASIQFAAQWPRRASDATINTLCNNLDDIFFDKLFEFIAFNERVSTSYSSIQSRIELQRLKRLTDDADVSNSVPRSYSLLSSDNRDFSVIVDFEQTAISRSFRTIATGGCKPEMYWAVRWQVNELVPALLALKPAALSESQSNTMDKLMAYLKENAKAADNELTPTERDVCRHWDLLIPIAIWLILGPKHPHASQNVQQGLKTLAEQLNAAVLASQTQDMDLGHDDRLEFTHASELEFWYLHLELAKTCAQFVTTATTFLKQKSHHAARGITVDALGKVKTEAKALADAVQKQASSLKGGLQKTGRQKVLRAVQSGGLGGSIERITGGEQLRMYVDEMVESAIEGLDGVSKVKVM